MATEERPLLRVLRGAPDDVELAALAAVVSGIAAADAADIEREAPRSPWSDPRATLRRPLSHGPGAWRASGLPG
jgi:Acyl-CoA carboxylase epsilon subunit